MQAAPNLDGDEAALAGLIKANKKAEVTALALKQRKILDRMKAPGVVAQAGLNVLNDTATAAAMQLSKQFQAAGLSYTCLTPI